MVVSASVSNTLEQNTPLFGSQRVTRGTEGVSPAKVTIVGMGYVGSVTGACLAEAGCDVTFAEVNDVKVTQLNAGKSPVVEKDVPELIREAQALGHLRATNDLDESIVEADTVIVCVGTPTGRNGDVHLGDLEKVCLQIGAALARRDQWLLVVVTSTVPPGTTESMIIPRLEESGKVCGTDFGVVFSPEFLREGSAVADFRTPAVTILGASDDKALDAATRLYEPFGGNIKAVSVSAAEAVKLVGNAWHALKVVFANEVGRFCESQDIDSRAVMDIFKEDRRLNVSAAYLNPGFAFGGSCLPKDLRTLNYRARREGVELPVLDNILRSNRAHVDLALQKIEEYGARRITVLGLAFKHGTDDLRESPNLELVERLLGKGYDVRLHDDSVLLPRLVGANRAHLLRTLPHVAAYLVDDMDEAIAGADLVIVAQGNPAYAGVVDQLSPGQQVLDLVGVARRSQGEEQYRGFLW
jgi:GDP-mannose 6-dehydrogenase